MTTKYGVKDLEQEFGELTFGELLTTWREGEEMNQTEFADFLEISRQSLCDLEKGRRIPSPERAASIAEKIGALPQSFIEAALNDQLKSLGLDYDVKLTKSAS